MNDISSEWFEMQYNVLNFIRSLMESGNETTIKRIAGRLTVTVLEDVCFRLTKKLYLREKILDKTVLGCLKSGIRSYDEEMKISKQEYVNLRLNKLMTQDLKLKNMYENTTDRCLKISGLLDSMKDIVPSKVSEKDLEKQKL